MNTWFEKRPNILFLIYAFCLWGLMPMAVTPWRKEIYYDGKMIFVIGITVLFLIIVKISGIRLVPEKPGVIEFLLAGFALLSVLSTFQSVDIQLSLWGQPHSREGLFVLLTYLIVFYLFYRFFHFSPVVFELVLVSAVLVSGYGILQYYGIVPPVSSMVKGAWETGLSTIGNRNFAGTYCTLFLPMCMGFWLYGRNGRGLIYSAVVFGFLMASMTRSAWLAFGVYSFLFFVFSVFSTRKYRMLLKWGVLMLVFAAIFVAMNSGQHQKLTKRAETIVNDAKRYEEDTSGSKRVYYWKRTGTFVFEQPLLGSGPDTFGKVFEKYHGNMKQYFEKAHNEYLQIAVTLGYPALITYLGLIGIVLLRLAKQLRGDRLSQVLFCCIIGYLVQACFNISVIPAAPVFWAMLGIGAKYRSEEPLWREPI